MKPSHPLTPFSPNHQGFTLVELAIVLAIVALLLGGLLPVLSAQVEQQHRNETRKQLSEIREALVGYAVINGRLPCPADGTAASGTESINAGPPTTCALTKGVLPWVTLGTSETDAWNRRFTYRVSSNFADGTDGTASGSCSITAGVSFQLCSTANLQVNRSAANGGSSVAADVPAVVVSHGPNGLGAYPAGGGAMIGTALTDELENSDDDNIFVSDDTVQNGFDDLVVWLSPNTLINRMVTSGRLP